MFAGYSVNGQNINEHVGIPIPSRNHCDNATLKLPHEICSFFSPDSANLFFTPLAKFNKLLVMCSVRVGNVT